MNEKGECDIQPPTAGIIIIGDEILKGNVVDTNSSFATTALHKLGVEVKKISVIGDNECEIAEEVRTFSFRYHYAIVSGGTGPTHDDVTYEAVAKAFNEPLVLHPELYKLCCIFYGINDETTLLTKEARVPKSAELISRENETYSGYFPLVKVHNVYLFPGIPRLFQTIFNSLGQQLFLSSAKFHSQDVYFMVEEEKLAHILSNLKKECPNVACGSYPVLENPGYMVKVSLESLDKSSLLDAHRKLLSAVPEHYIAAIEN